MAQADRQTTGTIDIATPNLTIPVSASAYNPNHQLFVEASSGNVDPTFTAMMSTNPRFSFTTKLITVLSSFGIAGGEITTAKMWLQQLVKHGTRNATSKDIIAATGMCLPRSLTVSQGAPAELQFDLFALSTDGAAVPITFATGAMDAIPTALVWTLGPVSLNGTPYDVESMTIDFGIQEFVEASSGNVYPTYITIMERRPTITLAVRTADIQGALDVTGLAQSGTDSVFYLRKLTANGTRVADVTAEHIKFTVDDGMMTIQDLPTTHGSPAMTNVLITPVYDGVAAIVLIDTASAIT